MADKNITHAQAQALTAAITAPLIALAREVVQWEREQADRHFLATRYGQVCNCADCTGNYKYPAHWSSIARRVLNNA